jgi:trk system potassium uptake protein TrkA
VKRIGIIGAGRFGSSLAEELARRGAEVIVIDRDRAAVQRLASVVARAVEGDATDIETLSESGIQECDALVVAIGTNMEGSILATMNSQELKVPHIVAKAVSDMHGKVLERLGVKEVVYPNRERAIRLARSLLASTALDYFEVYEGLSVAEMIAPKELVGKTLIESKLRARHGITVLLIRRPESTPGAKRPIITPNGDDIIREGDTLLLFGPDKALEVLSG